MNWCLLGLQALAGIDPAYKDAFRKVLKLVLAIQDKTPCKMFSGCWRGMYDLDAGNGGGGDRFEGGAGSIYTGWTNAPIASVIAMEIANRDLFSQL